MGPTTDVIDDISKIQRMASVGEVLSTFSDIVANFGVDYFIITGLPMPGGRLSPLVLLNYWPDGWWERYMGQNYIHSDPVAQNCYQTSMPFAWTEAPPLKRNESLGFRILNEASEHGMQSGMSVPIHTEDGLQACVSVAGSKLRTDDRSRTSIHALALYTHGHLRNITGDKIKRSGQLTPREREVATWVAVGKTYADVGEILGITERTVTAHIQSAAQKLNAVNRTSMIVEAIRYKQIQI